MRKGRFAREASSGPGFEIPFPEHQGRWEGWVRMAPLSPVSVQGSPGHAGTSATFRVRTELWQSGGGCLTLPAWSRQLQLRPRLLRILGDRLWDTKAPGVPLAHKGWTLENVLRKLEGRMTG